MFLRYVAESIRRSPRRKAMTVAAVAMGTAVAAAMLGVMLDIGDKVNLELRSMGANILVVPAARAAAVNVDGITALPASSENFIAESQVPKVKKIFWALNVTGFAPSLTVPARINGTDVPVRGVWFDHIYEGNKHAGIRLMNPAWKITGRWPQEIGASQGGAPREALAGAALRLSPGATIQLFGQPFTVTGVLSSGSDEDNQLLVRLADLQPLVHRDGQVDAIQVAALTKPEDDFARKDPEKMSPADKERWYCSNYVTAISRDIEKKIPGTIAKPVWRVADGEGRVLSKITGLMSLIALAALIAAALTVWSVMATTVMERRGEIAIMQATGATDFLISTLFAAEVAIEGFTGGLIGVLIGLQMARWVGRSVFGTDIEAPAILAPVAILLAIIVAVAGAMPPLRRSLATPPALVLRERV
jgi:putative ABC transport system permease protein